MTDTEAFRHRGLGAGEGAFLMSDWMDAMDGMADTPSGQALPENPIFDELAASRHFTQTTLPTSVAATDTISEPVAGSPSEGGPRCHGTAVLEVKSNGTFSFRSQFHVTHEPSTDQDPPVIAPADTRGLGSDAPVTHVCYVALIHNDRAGQTYAAAGQCAITWRPTTPDDDQTPSGWAEVRGGWDIGGAHDSIRAHFTGLLEQRGGSHTTASVLRVSTARVDPNPLIDEALAKLDDPGQIIWLHRPAGRHEPATG
jgi:hypothetical protein